MRTGGVVVVIVGIVLAVLAAQGKLGTAFAALRTGTVPGGSTTPSSGPTSSGNPQSSQSKIGAALQTVTGSSLTQAQQNQLNKESSPLQNGFGLWKWLG